MKGSDEAAISAMRGSSTCVAVRISPSIHAARVADEWLALSLALVGSTLLSMAATALTLQFFLRYRERKERA